MSAFRLSFWKSSAQPSLLPLKMFQLTKLKPSAFNVGVGTEGKTAGASAGPASGVQAKTSYRKGMAVFVHAKGGLMYEATIGGQKFSYTAY